jgi:hypothetical protein
VAATDRAVSKYDSNGDQKLSREELKLSPGLLAAINLLDRNGDGSISSDELKAMLLEIEQQQAALVEIPCTVTRNNRPLAGAKVELVPETFLGNAIKPASGITDRDGTTYLSVDAEELPEALRNRVKGVHCGIYRVVVTHPSVNVPVKYNTQTELGRIVSRRDYGPLTVAF